MTWAIVAAVPWQWEGEADWMAIDDQTAPNHGAGIPIFPPTGPAPADRYWLDERRRRYLAIAAARG